ncbi:MAG: hypothetical protein Q8K99_09890 [Actinomycetota bacterium]|nr:hypothetical protein [Actinomycetota bacterium]
MSRRIIVVLHLVVLLLASSVTHAFAEESLPHYVLGYQYSKSYAGMQGSIWAYNWFTTENEPGGHHVSSFYINPDGWEGLMDDYIEAGLCKGAFTIYSGSGDQRPVFFHAYEDYPKVVTQVYREHGRASIGAWHTVKIANYQTSTGAPSDWCVYFNGVCRVDSAPYGWYVGQPITASERKLVTDHNHSAFSGLMNRKLSGTHANWTSIAYYDNDIGYRPFTVGGNAWNCIIQ